MASTASVAGNVAKFRFSTDDFSERERLTAWREIFGRTVCRLDIEPLAGPRFQAESTVYALPGIGVLSGCQAVPEPLRDTGSPKGAELSIIIEC